MTDRELLEMAAKAVGYDTSHRWNRERMDFDPPVIALCIPGISTGWNPLDNDADALRLAAKLRISIDFNDCCAWSRGIFGLVQEFWGGDYPNCYRNAIVRAAAEIGKEAS